MRLSHDRPDSARVHGRARLGRGDAADGGEMKDLAAILLGAVCGTALGLVAYLLSVLEGVSK